MPTITLPPILVDPVNFSRPSGNYAEPPYEFQVGTDIYLVYLNRQIPVIHHISVYLSTDFGATWTAQDELNAPATAGNGFTCFQETGLIDICYLIGGAFTIVQFDTTAKTWGTPTASASVGENQFFFYRQTGGDYIVVFNHSSHIAYIKYSSGVWDGAATNLVAINDGIFGGAVTSADVAFVFAAPNAGGTAGLYRIDAALAVTGPFALTNPWSNITRPSVRLFSTDSVAVAQIPSSGADTVVVEIGTPLASPVMTRYGIYTKAVTEDVTWATLVVGSDGKLNVFWVIVDYTTTPLVDQLDQSIFDGASTWGAPTVFYDEITNIPSNSVPDQMDQFLHTADGIQLGDGTWVFSTAMETLDAAVQHCTGFVLRNPLAPSQSLRLEKTVSGGSALPAMWLLTGTGTTQTVSAAGDTGVVAVTDPQTFQLAESAGPDGYTGPVIDCGAAVMPTPTSVIVDDSGSTVVLAAQVPSSPAFEAGPVGPLPYYAEIGANLYHVLYRTSGKIGMFMRATADVGLPWAELDTTNSPDQGQQSGRAEISVNGSIISVAYLKLDARTIKICTFNTGSGLWGTPTVSTSTPTATLARFVFVQRSDSTYVVIGIWASQLYYFTNIAGVWSIANVIGTGGGLIMGQGFIDPSDSIWFQIQPQGLIFNNTQETVPLVQVSSSYVTTFYPILSSLPTAPACRTQYPGGAYPYKFNPSLVLWSSGTKLGIAELSTDNNVHVKTVTSLSTTPAFTDYLVYTPAGTETATYYCLAEGLDGKLNLFFVSADTVGPAHKVFQSIFDGVSTWSAPAAFYDAVTHPPSNGDGPNQVISALSAVDLVAGWTLGASMRTLQGPSAPTGEFIEAVTVTGQVVCTFTNTFSAPGFAASCPSPVYVVGTPYDSFVTVTGGVGPFTFAVTSGSLPTGLSLNASTGEITGTPSADGPFTFVITVTDSTMATTTTGSCSAGRCPGTISLI